MSLPLNLRLVLAWLALCALWGSTYLVVKLAVLQMPAVTLVANRFLLATLVMGALAWGMRVSWPGNLRAFQVPLWSAVLGIAGSNFLGAWSEEYLSSGSTALLAATGPLFIAGFQSLQPGGRRPGWMAIAGIAVAIAGVGVLTGGGITGADHPLGIALALFSSLVWGLSTVYLASAMGNWNRIALCTAQFACGALMFRVAATVTGSPQLPPPTADAWGPVIYLAVLGSGAATLCYLFLLRHVEPVRCTTFTYINPIVAVLLGAWILEEPLKFRVWVAVGVILLGVWLVEWEGFRARRTPAVRPLNPEASDEEALS